MSSSKAKNTSDREFVWKEKVLGELNKGDVDHNFHNKIEDVFITIEDGLSHSSVEVSSWNTAASNDWKISAHFDVLDEKKSNQTILETLLNGADTIYVSSSKSSIDWDVLFEEIEFQYIQIFISIADQKLFTSFKSWYKHQENITVLINFMSVNDPSEFIHTIASSQVPIKIVADGFSLQQCGANAKQELAFIINNLHESILLLGEHKNIGFQFHVGVSANFMIEIAKFRVLKILANSVLNAYDVPTNSFEVVGIIGWTNKSLKDSTTNQLRQTTEALSAVIGGVDYLQIHPFDSQSKNGATSFSQRMALNISSILKEESYLKLVKDAYRGSHYVENLTEKIGDDAWKIFKQLASFNEFISSEKIDFIAGMVRETTKLRHEEFIEKERKMIGMNVFQDLDPNAKEWKEEKTFLGLNTFRYDKIEMR